MGEKFGARFRLLILFFSFASISLNSLAIGPIGHSRLWRSATQTLTCSVAALGSTGAADLRGTLLLNAYLWQRLLQVDQQFVQIELKEDFSARADFLFSSYFSHRIVPGSEPGDRAHAQRLFNFTIPKSWQPRDRKLPEWWLLVENINSKSAILSTLTLQMPGSKIKKNVDLLFSLRLIPTATSQSQTFKIAMSVATKQVPLSRVATFSGDCR